MITSAVRIIFFTISLLFSVPVLAQQTLPPSNQPVHQPQQEHIAPDNRGTRDVPFIVKQLPREQSAEEEKQEKAKAALDSELAEYTRNLATYTEGLLVATLALAVITGALFGAAVYQMREGHKAINAATASAKAADRHIALAFRPKLVVRRISLDKWTIGAFGEIQFIVANVGVSPGTIVERNATIYVLDKDTLPAIPPYSESAVSMGIHVIDTGPGIPDKATTLMPVTEQQYDRVFGALPGRLHLIGYIVYDGEGGRQHMAFGRVYDVVNKRFSVVNDPNYEYGE